MWHSLLPFIALLVYNLARLGLLYKTKTLELELESTGLHPRFSFASRGPLWMPWGTFFAIVRWGFLVQIGLVLWNTIHFLFWRWIEVGA